jgi:hypothetical protein
MKAILCFSVIGLLIAGGSHAWAVPSSPLWVDDDNNNIGLVDIATGSVTVVGNAGTTQIHDLGFTENGNLYGTAFDGLYSISQTTGAETFISDYSSVDEEGMNALVGSGNVLYGASSDDLNLYEITPGPIFAITQLSGTLAGYSAGDVAFDASGDTLYEADQDGNLDKIVITGNSFTATVVGSMGNDGIVGLATGDDGVTYAVSENDTELYTVDLSNAQLTPVLDYGGQGLTTALGQAFETEGTIGQAVPEPGTLSLFAFGLAGLAVYGYKRRTKIGPPAAKA